MGTYFQKQDDNYCMCIGPMIWSAGPRILPYALINYDCRWLKWIPESLVYLSFQIDISKLTQVQFKKIYK